MFRPSVLHKWYCSCRVLCFPQAATQAYESEVGELDRALRDLRINIKMKESMLIDYEGIQEEQVRACTLLSVSMCVCMCA